MKSFKSSDHLLRVLNPTSILRTVELVAIGLLATSLAWATGCSAFDHHKMYEKELAETRTKLEQATQLADRLSIQVKTQEAELALLKERNVSDVRREKEQALAEIELKRQELEQERFQIDQMRELDQTDALDQQPPKMSVREMSDGVH